MSILHSGRHIRCDSCGSLALHPVAMRPSPFPVHVAIAQPGLPDGWLFVRQEQNNSTQHYCLNCAGPYLTETLLRDDAAETPF